ncbi:MAG TPA: hypothetical protein PKL48_12045 [Thermodesulfobacteriota bacterium]|nr:hypothetical protein [Thermodesulfobacteriota bacterium]
MHTFTDDINQSQFFWFDKRLISSMQWAILSKASKAVFPVIACHANKQGQAFPGERTIGNLAGITDKVARAGISGLRDFSHFDYDYYITARGKRAKRYHLQVPQKHDRGASFPFFRYVLDSGAWHEALPTAKALYPVMRHFAGFDVDEYIEAEGKIGLGVDTDFDEIWTARKYDFCTADPHVLCEYAGIHRNSLPDALKSLERVCLIDRHEGRWRVYLRTKDRLIFAREFLNQQIRKARQNEINKTDAEKKEFDSIFG